MEKLFKTLGLNQIETDIYLKLLELGAQPVSTIAKKIGTPRTTMYTHLEKLKKKNIIAEFTRTGIKYYKSTSPADIQKILKKKEDNYKEAQDILQSNMDSLEELENKQSVLPRVMVYESKDNIRKMYDEILNKESFCAIFNPEAVKAHMPEYHYKIPETAKAKGVKVKELLIDSPEAKNYQKKFTSKTHQIKILEGEYIVPSDIIICEDCIYMISYKEDEIGAIKIVNQALTRTQQIMFEKIWESNT